jgi:LPS O-antigen subunit length determinant protein (WzzB/FepE family)
MNSLKLINKKQTIMNEEILIPISLFLTVFGIFYLYLSTRNKERLALIEKGVDASIFMGGVKQSSPSRKVFILNFALLLMGIGVGVFIALLLSAYTTLDQDAVYPATIFTMAGVGLFIGYNMTKNLEQ